MGCITRLEARRSTLGLMLDVAKREVILQKGVVLQAMGIGDGAWTEAEMVAFNRKAHLHNVFSHRRYEPGHINYTMQQ
jgi:hypothetical protein